jgi:hypothetical protein
MKERIYPFTREGYEKAKRSKMEMLIKNKKFDTAITTVGMVLLTAQDVYAKGGDNAGWQLIGKVRQGLFWICLFTSFYGLYLVVLKKDDAGKKVIVNSVLAYAGSFVLPEIFLAIQKAFS